MSIFKTHVGYGSCELYSVGSRNYFGNNGELYKVTSAQLEELLSELKELNQNPMVCAEYLIKQALTGRLERLFYTVSEPKKEWND